MSKPSVWIILAAVSVIAFNLWAAYVFSLVLFDGLPTKNGVYLVGQAVDAILPVLAGILLFFQKREGFWLLLAFLVFRAISLVFLLGSMSGLMFAYVFFYGEMIELVAALVVLINRDRLEPIWARPPDGVANA